MDCIQKIERLILRLPAIADEAASVAAFWETIDEAMMPVWDCVETEEERAEIETRYEDLVDMANALGFIQDTSF
jgi:hypothetical protein